jgi:hypothetical protein
MFTQVRLIAIPPTLQPKLEIGYKFIFGALAVMLVGMFIASGWQWLFNIKSNTLMDSPLLLQVMMIGGFVTYLLALLVTLIVLPIWHDVRHGRK